jgi:hypothetical protein
MFFSMSSPLAGARLFECRAVAILDGIALEDLRLRRAWLQCQAKYR